MTPFHPSDESYLRVLVTLNNGQPRHMQAPKNNIWPEWLSPPVQLKKRGLQEAEKAGYAATEAVAAGSQSREAAVILVTVFWKWQQGSCWPSYYASEVS
jgi:hypothetical protein